MSMDFEVHVEGELAAPTLHRLGWAHRVAEAPTVLHVETTPAGLQQLLRECCDRGLTIEDVVRVHG